MMGLTTALGGGDLGTLALGLVIAGVVSGLVAGMLGVGGGIVIVPVMYHVLAVINVPEDLRMHVAVGTSLATIIPTSISSLRAHNKKGVVDWDLLKRWAAPMLIGVLAGSVLAGLARGQTLALVFGLVALPIAAQFGFGKETWRLADRLPGGAGGMLLPFGIGGVSTMMGIGGGLLGVTHDAVRRADPPRGGHRLGVRRDHLDTGRDRRGDCGIRRGRTAALFARLRELARIFADLAGGVLHRAGGRRLCPHGRQEPAP